MHVFFFNKRKPTPPRVLCLFAISIPVRNEKKLRHIFICLRTPFLSLSLDVYPLSLSLSRRVSVSIRENKNGDGGDNDDGNDYDNNK